MAHNHAHDHQLPVTGDLGKAFYVSIGLNLLYVVAEVVAGFAYDSMALLTDAGHNVSDIASLLLSLLAYKLSHKRPTDRFTYGYKKTTILAAFANACILLIALGILGFEIVKRFQNPRAVEGNIIAWVAGLGIVINAVSAFLFYKNRKNDLNVKSAYLHLLADALVSVGVVIAGIVIQLTGWYLLDPIIGVVVLIVILISTWHLFTDSFKLTVDAVPPGIDLQNVRNSILEIPHVRDVKHVHIWALSTTENSLTAHVLLDNELDLQQRIHVISEIKHELLHHNIRHSTIEMMTEVDGKASEIC